MPETAHTRMMEKLRRRCGQQSPPLIEIPQKSASKWHRVVANVIENESKSHQVEKRYVLNRDCNDGQGFIYLAFRAGSPMKLIGTYRTAEEAKTACDEDRQEAA